MFVGIVHSYPCIVHHIPMRFKPPNTLNSPIQLQMAITLYIHIQIM